jgi:long-chain acyl-CoA synthetase
VSSSGETPASPDGVAGVASSRPDSVAIRDGSTSISFARLDDRQRGVAGLLTAAGAVPGDRIAVLSGNRPEYLEVTMGCLRAGLLPVPINPLLKREEVDYIARDSGARFMFSDRPQRSLDVEEVFVFGAGYESSLESAPRLPLADHVRGRPMHYTSGTTGVPKGVFVAFEDPARAAGRSRDFRSTWGMTAEDVHLVCSPLGHSAPHRFALRTLESGGTVILTSHFDALSVARTIARERVTSTFMVPTHLERILGLGPQLASLDLSSMRLLAHAGAPIRETTKLDAMRAFPASSMWEFYGSTEGPATRISPEEWLQKRGSVGRPYPGAEILISNEQRERVPPGEVGEVWVHDPRAERFAYWNDPAKTAAAWREDAFTAGDLGWVDGDGYLYLTGRRHDTIITGGVNVYPQEVELVLQEHPRVAEAVVYGVPSEEWGQEVRARVVVAAPVDPGDLREWLRARIASYKCPREIQLATSLERTATGKLKRPPGDELP